MESATLYKVLIIIGAFGSLILTVNAFFLKEIFKDLNNVKVQLAKYMEKLSAKDKEIEELKENQKELFSRINKLEREV